MQSLLLVGLCEIDTQFLVRCLFLTYRLLARFKGNRTQIWPQLFVYQSRFSVPASNPRCLMRIWMLYRLQPLTFNLLRLWGLETLTFMAKLGSLTRVVLQDKQQEYSGLELCWNCRSPRPWGVR